jgi:RIO-like serine/threonine protein kinase
MSDIDLQVLRAVARLSRMRREVDCETLVLRAGGSADEVRASLGRLTHAALLERSDAPRLTMAGLAVAVASGAAVGRKRRAPVAARRAA